MVRLLLEKLQTEFGKKSRFTSLVLPCPSQIEMGPSIYNTLLAFPIEKSSLNVFFDNASLFKICEKEGVKSPDFSDVNTLMGYQMRNYLSAMSSGPSSMTQVCTNLTPYPRIQHVMP